MDSGYKLKDEVCMDSGQKYSTNRFQITSIDIDDSKEFRSLQKDERFTPEMTESIVLILFNNMKCYRLVVLSRQGIIRLPTAHRDRGQTIRQLLRELYMNDLDSIFDPNTFIVLKKLYYKKVAIIFAIDTSERHQIYTHIDVIRQWYERSCSGANNIIIRSESCAVISPKYDTSAMYLYIIQSDYLSLFNYLRTHLCKSIRFILGLHMVNVRNTVCIMLFRFHEYKNEQVYTCISIANDAHNSMEYFSSKVVHFLNKSQIRKVSRLGINKMYMITCMETHAGDKAIREKVKCYNKDVLHCRYGKIVDIALIPLDKFLDRKYMEVVIDGAVPDYMIADINGVPCKVGGHMIDIIHEAITD